MQWLLNFKDSDGLTARWLEKLAIFVYEIVHGSEKRTGHADSVTRISNQDVTMDQANAHTSGAEAKHPLQNNDEASDTESPNLPHMGKRTKPVTNQKKQMKQKSHQQHPYTRDDEQ